jgi:hypothetical protein
LETDKKNRNIEEVMFEDWYQQGRGGRKERVKGR